MTNTTGTATKSIYVDQTTIRTFAIGEKVDYYVGTARYVATIVSFDGGLIHYRLGASTEVHASLGAVFARALTPSRRPVEQLVRGW